MSTLPHSLPLEHQDEVHQAAFSPDGRRVVTASSDSTARVWDIAAEDRPTKDWVALAQLLTGHEIDGTGGLQPLTRERLLELWTTLRAKYPQDFTVTPEQARAWHRREAEACLQEKHTFGYIFHLAHAGELRFWLSGSLP